MIEFTEAAQQHLKNVIDSSEIVRVAIQGGGCAGMSYALNIETELDDEDITFEFGHVRVCIDPYSANLLEETTVDFAKSLQREGFVFNNPKSNTTCGCGMSFS